MGIGGDKEEWMEGVNLIKIYGKNFCTSTTIMKIN
jgi:hypothetical protein